MSKNHKKVSIIIEMLIFGAKIQISSKGDFLTDLNFGAKKTKHCQKNGRIFKHCVS